MAASPQSTCDADRLSVGTRDLGSPEEDERNHLTGCAGFRGNANLDGNNKYFNVFRTLKLSGERRMKRYYFDLYNSDGLVADETGEFFESRDRARAEALRILHDVARDEMPDRDLVKITVKMRDEAGTEAFEASLTLNAAWSS